MGTSREPAVKVGETIEGRYRILKPLDEGGMGTVYLAEHVLIHRRVAIKILHAELAADVDVVERFMNEAKAAGTLGHPNIVESTDMGFTRNDIPYIVFEYLEGTLLADEIFRVKGLTVRRSLRIANQIASALDAAHNAGIIHRDLKSENVFLTDKMEQTDHVKVLDFGISRFQEVESDSARRGEVMGTPEFMAPEQISDPENVDKRCDVYALGVVLYEMLTGRRPFPNRNDQEALLTSIIKDPPPPLDRPDAPVGLQEMIVDKLLAKSPAHRYQTMKDVQAALQAFTGVARPSRDSEPIVTVPATVVAAAEQPAGAQTIGLRPPAPHRRSRWVWLVAALLVGGAGVGSMFIPRPAGQAPTNQPTMTALTGDADRLAQAFDGAAAAAHARAAGIAGSPMLRAAIETDSATLQDMAGGDFLFTPNKGEVLEIFQIQPGGAIASMLRIPAGAAPMKPISGEDIRVVIVGDAVRLIASAPVARRDGQIGGAAAIGQEIELVQTKRSLEQHALAAKLVGLSSPLALVGSDKTTSERDVVTVPVNTTHDFKLKLALSATIAPAAMAKPAEDPYEIPRYGAWGVAGLLFLIYAAGLLRPRK